jgi:hypothetical protein
MAQILTRNNDILWKLIDGKVVLLDMDEAMEMTLNDVGSHIWMALERQKTHEELVQDVVTAFDIDGDTAKKDTHSFLNEMIKKDLIRAG